MNDRALRVLEQYDLEIRGTRRGRGSWYLDTAGGFRILSEYSASGNRAFFQNFVMGKIRDGGYPNVDVILPNKEGALVSRDWEGNRYVVKEWYAGRECDASNEPEILAAVENLARLHRLMEWNAEDFSGFSKVHEGGNQSPALTGNGGEAGGCYPQGNPDGVPSGKGNAAMAQGRSEVQEDVRSFSCGEPFGEGSAAAALGGTVSGGCGAAAAFGETVSREGSAAAAFGETVSVEGGAAMDLGGMDFRRDYTARPPLDELCAWNAQLRKIRSFIRGRHRKSAFEQLFLDNFERYYEQAREAREQLSLFNDRLEALRAAHDGSICHGDYSHHHVLMCGYEIATTNFDRCCFDFQVNDLYRFMRKILEKHDWNVRLGMRMLDTYGRVRAIPWAERKLLYVRMLYPEKFRKLAGAYYGSNKAWISRQYSDKLGKINRQEAARQEFVRALGN
ncbi:MAG: hypothetical protein LUG99_05195 [Lachnospiraceae bacterium]|nr:hypothetical protein [Lachnospiraceae bacterium]